MKGFFGGSILSLVIMAFGAAYIGQYTPHPNMAVLLGFSILRGFFLQLQQVRLRTKLELGELSHVRLVSRIDRMEWEMIYGALGRRY